ncbi:MAG: J domain-containing protein [Myxococcales bacterium]|nr:J domain-containing protein [Polyangiaceae bacterium]MDW8250676.1 J domain-containing protein [Myxococcales bacterium]
MIRKFALAITTPNSILALADLALTLNEEPLSAWQEPAQSALAWWSQVARHAEGIHELATTWPSCRSLKIKTCSALEDTQLLHLELNIDLEILFHRRDALLLSQHLYTLLQRVEKAGWYRVTGKLGNRRVDQLPPILRALVQYAVQYGIDLEPQAPPPPTTPPHSSLNEEEQFFLSYARLAWPCGEAEIKVAYRQVVKAAHPDKHVGDPTAHHRFLLLQRGFEELLRRLGR